MSSAIWKYHGLGNDFILADRRGLPDLLPDVTRAACARHTGIGADGILSWTEQDGRPHMRVFNADGSIADMCGNGLRCFVRWLIDTQGFSAESMTVMSDAGPQHCIPVVENGVVVAVTVNRGAAKHDGTVEVSAGGRDYRGHCLFVGNPHYVISRAPEPGEVGSIGPLLSTHPAFPRGVNVGWLDVTSETTARLVVYERGAGLTQACGTGGGGAVATAVLRGEMSPGESLVVAQPGGELRYRVAAAFDSVTMTGPAAPVFNGSTRLF
jgi:diaminopimelate epimerase